MRAARSDFVGGYGRVVRMKTTSSKVEVIPHRRSRRRRTLRNFRECDDTTRNRVSHHRDTTPRTPAGVATSRSRCRVRFARGLQREDGGRMDWDAYPCRWTGTTNSPQMRHVSEAPRDLPVDSSVSPGTRIAALDSETAGGSRLGLPVGPKSDRWRDLNPRPPGYDIFAPGSVG